MPDGESLRTWWGRPVPPARTVAFGLVCLLAIAGTGVALWGLPLRHPLLGDPGRFVEAPVTPTNLARPRAANSPVLALDPREPRFAALAHRYDDPLPACGLQVSGDGGESWVGARPVPVLPAGVERCANPEVAIDGRGTLHYLFSGMAGNSHEPQGAFLVTSADRAATFTAPRRVLGPGAYGVRLAVDRRAGRGGRLHLAWLQAGAQPTATGFGTPANRVMTAFSVDGGNSFSKPIAVSRTGRMAAPAMALGPGGDVRVAYFDLGNDARDFEGTEGPTWPGRWSLLLGSSDDGGRRFAPSVVVDGAVAPAGRVPSIFTMASPAVAAGRLGTCLAWTDARLGDADVMLRCRTPAGRWLPAQRVNDDAKGNGRSQHLPEIAMAPGGRLDITFYDRRSDQRNRMVAVAFSYTYDGRRFSPNTALARSLFSAEVGLAPKAGGEAPVELSSRMALVSGGSSAIVAWTDTRNTREAITSQDIYSAQASLLFSSGRPRWATPGGLGLTLASSIALVAMRRRPVARP